MGGSRRLPAKALVPVTLFCLCLGVGAAPGADVGGDGLLVVPALSSGQAETPGGSPLGGAEFGAVRPVEGMIQDKMEMLCAVNCLYFVCRYSGRDVDYASLRHLLQPSVAGVSMSRLKQVLDQLGFASFARRMSPARLPGSSGPVVVLVPRPGGDGHPGHYCVVLPSPAESAYWIVDPPGRKARFASRDDKGSPLPASFDCLVIVAR